MQTLEDFLTKFPSEIVHTPRIIDSSKYPDITDKKDLPVLVSAIIGDVDILITGDKNFAIIKIDRPEILTPREFIEKYG